MRGACHLDGHDLVLTVADSGAGVDAGMDAEADLFSRGRRPAPDADRVHGLGVGLPLSRELARRRGGDVWLIEAAGTSALTGALFGARLCGVLGDALDGGSSDAGPLPDRFIGRRDSPS